MTSSQRVEGRQIQVTGRKGLFPDAEAGLARSMIGTWSHTPVLSPSRGLHDAALHCAPSIQMFLLRIEPLVKAFAEPSQNKAWHFPHG